MPYPTTTTSTVDPNGGKDYPNCSTWEAAEQQWAAYTGDVFADLYRTGATIDTSDVGLAGWNAGVNFNIIANAAHRHNGDPDSGYILSSGTSDNIRLGVSGVNGVIDGIVIKPTSGRFGIVASFGVGIVNITNCYVYGGGTSVGKGIVNAVSGTYNIYNTIISGFGGASNGHGISCDGSATINSYNCTSFGNRIGFVRIAGTHTAKNCVSQSNSSSGFFGTYGAGSDYNVSSDATAPGTNKATGKTAYSDYFVDHAAGDFHLKNTSLALWGLAGTDLSGTFTTDIDGQTRVNWDIGADEYIAAGGSSVTSDFSTAYDIRAIVNSDFSTVYDIRQIASSDFAVAYNILQSAFSDFGTVYDIRQEVSGDFTVAFDIRNIVTSDFSTVYDMAGSVFSDFTVVYDLGKQLVKITGRLRLRLGLRL